ncbi:hypothetical protein [Verrucomicrobium sp. BvORR106]|uniref:hypothetical protein n=1 Tax=Verrucomicrobium sp. BvORR106 TaxID=1403819 RepID=UPI00056FBD1F|nr:hypothetical protein [Verrucomicrobium sp. BvORR106]
MKTKYVPALTWLTTLLIVATDLPVCAQEAPNAPVPAAAAASTPPVPARRRTIFPGVDDSTSVQLKQNYRIHLTISGTGEKKRECTLLTSSRQVKSSLFAGELGDTSGQNVAGLPTGLRISLSGLLDEVDEGLRFQYSLTTSIPTPNSVQNSDKGTTITSYSYTEEGTTSSVLMKPGKTYDVLKSGSRIYTLSIEALKDDP